MYYNNRLRFALSIFHYINFSSCAASSNVKYLPKLYSIDIFLQGSSNATAGCSVGNALVTHYLIFAIWGQQQHL